MDNRKLRVSVLCITYNQKEFINKCLNGMVNQKTNFDYEIIIHDDASTDGTTEIIKEYEKKYPNLIKALYEDENQYSKGRFGYVLKDLYSKCSGEYVALCEGDDYWTDENKLQIQVDFMEKHKNYSGCFHLSERIDHITGKHVRWTPQDNYRKKWKWRTSFDIRYTLRHYFIETCSVMYRLGKYKQEFLDSFPMDIINFDTYTIDFFALKGKIKYINKLMSIKTINDTGIWNSKQQSIDERNVKFRNEIMNFDKILNSEFSVPGLYYKKDVFRRFYKIVQSIIALNENEKLVEFVKNYYSDVNDFIEEREAFCKKIFRILILTNVLSILFLLVLVLLLFWK